MKVLVVDDDQIVCDGLKQVIPWDALGIEFLGSALNGEDAFKMAVEARPDIIISDICMPKTDGLQLCKKVRETLEDTTIIIMSAYEDFDYARQAMKYGVKDYIIKPIDPQKVEKLTDLLKNVKKEKEARKNAIQDFFGGKLKREFLDIIHGNDKDQIIGYLQEKISQYMLSNDDIREICLQFIDVLYLYLEEIGIGAEASKYSKSDVIRKILALKSYEEVRSFTVTLFENILGYIKSGTQSHSMLLAARAKKIVDEEYMNEAISLQYLADKLDLSPQHISSMFGQICGMNFSEYLIKIRVEKSCELLKDATIKINDISSRVGYADSHYFAKVFKRVMHRTPSEYRSIVGNAYLKD